MECFDVGIVINNDIDNKLLKSVEYVAGTNKLKLRVLAGYVNSQEFLDYCKKNASEVAIFEGSWDTDEISDLNNIMPKYVDDWEKTRVTISKNEYY